MSEIEIGKDLGYVSFFEILYCCDRNHRRVLFNETDAMAPGFPSESMDREEIENLPLGWQYLLPHIFYDGWVDTYLFIYCRYTRLLSIFNECVKVLEFDI